MVPKNSSPIWAQLAVYGAKTLVTTAMAWELPPGTAPVIAWLEGSDVPSSIESFFGPGVPSWRPEAAGRLAPTGGDSRRNRREACYSTWREPGNGWRCRWS